MTWCSVHDASDDETPYRNKKIQKIWTPREPTYISDVSVVVALIEAKFYVIPASPSNDERFLERQPFDTLEAAQIYLRLVGATGND